LSDISKIVVNYARKNVLKTAHAFFLKENLLMFKPSARTTWIQMDKCWSIQQVSNV